MSKTLPVTDAEFDAITAASKLSRLIVSDSQYQVTDSDRAIRARGRASYAAALARFEGFHVLWANATNDSDRAYVERLAAASEANCKRVPFVRGFNL